MNKKIKTTGNREVLINQDLIKLGKKLIKKECKCDTDNEDLAATYAIVYSIRCITRDDFNFSLGYQWFTYGRGSDKAIGIDLGREVTPMHDKVHSTLYFVYGDHGKLLGIGINKDNDPYIDRDLYVEFDNLANGILPTLYGMVVDMYMDARRAIIVGYARDCMCDECIDNDEALCDDGSSENELIKAYNTVNKVLDALKVGSDYKNDYSDRSYLYVSRAELMGIGLSALLNPDGEYSRTNMLKHMKHTHYRYCDALSLFPEDKPSNASEYKREYYAATLKYLFVYILQFGLDEASDAVNEFIRTRTTA